MVAIVNIADDKNESSDEEIFAECIRTYKRKFVEMCVKGFNETPSRIIDLAEENGKKCINDCMKMARRYPDLPQETIDKYLNEFRDEIKEAIEQLKIGPKGFMYLSSMAGGSALAVVSWAAHGAYAGTLWLINSAGVIGGLIGRSVLTACGVSGAGGIIGLASMGCYAAYRKYSGLDDEVKQKLMSRITTFFNDAFQRLKQLMYGCSGSSIVPHTSGAIAETTQENKQTAEKSTTKVALNTPFGNSALEVSNLLLTNTTVTKHTQYQ